jgi:hypothetical protein
MKGKLEGMLKEYRGTCLRRGVRLQVSNNLSVCVASIPIKVKYLDDSLKLGPRLNNYFL